jgi:molecular chaperone GrpE
MKKKKEKKEELEIMGEGALPNEEHPEHENGEVQANQEDEDQELNDQKEPADPIDEIKESLSEIEKKAEEYLDGWQRSRAEFANYKKRILREQTGIHQAARGEVIKIYLDIADDLKRALEGMPNSKEVMKWAAGIEIIYEKLMKRLEAEGVKPMDALGQEFDPNIHEALMKEENEDFESGQIIEVMQEGYWIGDKVLRPALVRVAA